MSWVVFGDRERSARPGIYRQILQACAIARLRLTGSDDGNEQGSEQEQFAGHGREYKQTEPGCKKTAG